MATTTAAFERVYGRPVPVEAGKSSVTVVVSGSVQMK